MRPTVISGGSGDNQPATTSQNQAQPSSNNSNQYPQPQQDANAREFPHFQSGFGFRPHFDDMFEDDDFGPHLRARMMRDPFAAFGGRKRYGYMPFDDDPYKDYFADVSDFFPGFHDPEWESMRSAGRRRQAPQSTTGTSNTRGNIFDHIPSQFRNYIPENFGFHQPNAQEYSQSHPPQQQYYEAHPQQQQQQQPQYQNYPEQQQQYYQQQQQAPRPKYCDASIQTEAEPNLEEGQHIQPHQNLNQHNLRNTVDLGTRAEQEGTNEPRSHSAPPVNNENYASASASAYAGPDDNAQAAYYASTGTDPQSPQYFPEQQQQQPSFYQQKPYPKNPPPPPQRQYIPPQYQNQPQYQQQQAPPRGQSAAQDDSGYVRHVPIFIEGRSEPTNSPPVQRRQRPQQQQQPPPQQRPVPPPQQEPHGRPTPLNTQQAQAHAQVNAQQGNQQVPPGPQVPQTPHTADCINKIQDIQRDVLNLMGQVEQFAGIKQDKEYLYLDEMLTRNLLKLDTIDTNGKDSIRLARREAIKCIQASINVLEAKAEENARAAQGSVMDTPQQLDSGETNVIALPDNTSQRTEAGIGTESLAGAPTQLTDSKDEQSAQQETGQCEPIQEASPIDNAKETPAEDTNQTSEKTGVESQPAGNTCEEIKQSNDIEQATNDLSTSNTDSTSAEAAQLTSANAEDKASLEPPKEQIEKSSSEKENKPPGSPKKKIIRKVKKVVDKKSTPPGSAGEESATPPSQEAEMETPEQPK